MKLVIIAVGRLKESFWREAAEEYKKRISPHASCVIEEVTDEPDIGPSHIVKQVEAKRIVTKLKDRDYIVALDVAGRRMSTEAFADHVKGVQAEGYGRYVFIIGGSVGLDDSVLHRADLRLSFSDFTFPHQLMRVILLEQLYRAFRIHTGAPYHK